jgi:cytosine/uracil/thiamine/allantoin permease
MKKIWQSFYKASLGQETTKVVEVFWFLSLCFVFYITHKINYYFQTSYFFTTLLIVILIIWHIYVVYKCKTIESSNLTKEEQQLSKIKKPSSVLKKILLREPISKPSWRQIVVVIDILLLLSALSWL